MLLFVHCAQNYSITNISVVKKTYKAKSFATWCFLYKWLCRTTYIVLSAHALFIDIYSAFVFIALLFYLFSF